MKILATDSMFNIYKFSLNKKERTLKVFLRSNSDKKYQKHLIAKGLTKDDVISIENSTEKDLLNWVKNDICSYFSIWR